MPGTSIDAVAPTGEQMVADVVGPVCESGDVFAVARRLDRVEAGDLMVIRTAGAYAATMAGTYNSRALAPEVLVDGAQLGGGPGAARNRGLPCRRTCAVLAGTRRTERAMMTRGRRQARSRSQRASPRCSGRPVAAQHAEPDRRSRPARGEYRERWRAFARERAIGLRPHAKTHKSIEIARRQLTAGAIGICCAKLGEAEILAAGGIESILVTSPVVTEEGGRRLAALNRLCPDLMVVTDCAANVDLSRRRGRGLRQAAQGGDRPRRRAAPHRHRAGRRRARARRADRRHARPRPRRHPGLCRASDACP